MDKNRLLNAILATIIEIVGTVGLVVIALLLFRLHWAFTLLFLAAVLCLAYYITGEEE